MTSPDWEKANGPRLMAWEDESLSVNATDPHPPNRRAIGPQISTATRRALSFVRP